MQQPHPDQQTQPQIQYTSPQYQQLQQPIMLCPVQYVYEQLLPDEQGQPSPAQPFQSQAYLLNVQNTPPWAQNRPNMIYMQQMSNMQPYMQQIVQNPMYNYQYQPMIVQEHIRQVPSYMNQTVMQNPQIVQNVQRQMMQNIAQNQQIMQTVQNQQMIQNSAQSQVMQNLAQNPQLMQNVVQNQVMNQNPGMMNSNIIQNPIRFQMEKRETPILASMLNVRKSLHQNEMVSILRPQYQNVRPQMIIVNPIAKHTCVHNTQKEPPPSPALIDKQLRNDIQNIRSQVPEGLSVKTIKVPATALVKPNENMFQNIAPADDIYPRANNKPKQLYNRDSQTNYKRKIKELLELNNKDEVLAKRMCPAHKPDEQIFKAQVLIDTQPNTSEIQTNNSTLPIVNTQINVTPQVEEKKLRNTVFVQARGRVDEVRVNEVQNVNYTNVSNTGTSIANIMINNKSIENLDRSVLVNNIHLELNKTNNQHFNIEAVNNLNVMHNYIMNLNNQSVEKNTGSETNINNIGNLEDVLMQIQMQTENNVTEGSFDNQFISEQVVQNIKVTTKGEKSPPLQDIVVVKENNRQSKVKLTQATTTADKNIGQNEAVLTGTILSENSSTITKKLLSNERKTRKSKNAKVTETDMTQYKSTITNVPQTANIEASNDSNDLQLPKNPGDDSINKSTITDMSIMTKTVISSDTNQNKSDEANVKISEEAKKIEKKGIKEIKNKSKLAKNDEVDKKNDNKLKVTKIEKPKKGKKKMVDAKVFAKEPVAMYVLTHVLDGHIIQESNVPFLVQKPSILPVKGKPIEREERVEINEKTEENIEDSKPVETKNNTVEESIRVETEVSSNTDTEKDKMEDKTKQEYDKPDTSVAAEGSPFKDLKKDIVVAWTISDVTSHLMKHANWRDTALKLADQEIDGESLLLASKDQLIQIDICEEQAQEICDFVEQVQ